MRAFSSRLARFADGQEAVFEACNKSGAVFMVKDTDEETVTRTIILN